MELNFKDYPLIMGVLNVTPDSFSDGGEYVNKQMAVSHALEMIEQGAEIIDVGGESTRPGADEVPEEIEINRVIPVIEEIRKNNRNIHISIDTTKYEVARLAIEAGANIINDISGLSFDIRLAELAAKHDIYLVIMHIQGSPRSMQVNPYYADPVVEVYDELKNKIAIARKKGVNKIIADVGIGFGKTYLHNIALIREHSRFKTLGVPLMIGISRKTFIGKMLNIENPEDRDLPTLIIHSLIIHQNTDILRVHDVKSHVMLKKILKKIKKNDIF